MRARSVVFTLIFAAAACDESRTSPGGGNNNNTTGRDAAPRDATAQTEGDAGTQHDGGTQGDAAQSDGGTQGDAAAQSDAGSGGLQGAELFAKLAGLWTGPVTDTRLGSFPLTNMDFRASSDSVLFGRVDLDANNSLRFAFAGELHDGARVLVYRNGGLFMGLSRDTRTKLVESTATTYRFCAIDGGCAYVDATFTFASETAFTLRVMVRGMIHEVWNARRVETRTLPAGFPARTDLAGDSDFPQMPAADIRVRFASAVTSATDVWVILSTTSCLPPSACQFSRWIKGVAPASSTDLTIHLDQLHAGTYSILGVVDANGDLGTTRLPNSGDLVTVPSPSLTAMGTATANVEATASFRFP